MRNSGRSNNELREIKFTKNYLKHPDGSVLVEFGDTKVIVTASVTHRVPRFLVDSGQGWLTSEYALLPCSTDTRIKRDRGGNLSGRTQEIQRLIGRSLRCAIDMTKIAEYTITIDADVIQADGGTRVASVTGGFVALYEATQKMLERGDIAENPIIEPVAAVSCGIKDGEVLLDLDYSEDSTADADANIVMMESGKIIEFQTTAEGAPFYEHELIEVLKSAEAGIKDIIALQKTVLGL